jgi:hypothetical protein
MIGTLYQAARLTLSDPRAGARWAMGLGLSAETAAEILILTGALGGILSVAVWGVVEDPAAAAGPSLLESLFRRPLLLAAIQTFVQLASAWAAHAIGRAFGGKGTLAQALAVVAWAEVLLLALQALQLVLLVALPPLAGIISPLALILFFWLMTAFVAEMHGFASSFGVFIGIILTGLAMAVAAALALAVIFGPGGLGNV